MPFKKGSSEKSAKSGRKMDQEKVKIKITKIRMKISKRFNYSSLKVEDIDNQDELKAPSSLE